MSIITMSKILIPKIGLTTGCPEKIMLQFLLNLSGQKHPRRLRKKKNGENSSPLIWLPVNWLNGDRLRQRPLMPISYFLII